MTTEHQKSPTQTKKPRTEIQIFEVPNPGIQDFGEPGSSEPIKVEIVDNVRGQILCRVGDRVYLRVGRNEAELTGSPVQYTYWMYLSGLPQRAYVHLYPSLDLAVRLRMLNEIWTDCPFQLPELTQEEDDD